MKYTVCGYDVLHILAVDGEAAVARAAYILGAEPSFVFAGHLEELSGTRVEVLE